MRACMCVHACVCVSARTLVRGCAGSYAGLEQAQLATASSVCAARTCLPACLHGCRGATEGTCRGCACGTCPAQHIRLFTSLHERHPVALPSPPLLSSAQRSSWRTRTFLASGASGSLDRRLKHCASSRKMVARSCSCGSITRRVIRARCCVVRGWRTPGRLMASSSTCMHARQAGRHTCVRTRRRMEGGKNTLHTGRATHAHLRTCVRVCVCLCVHVCRVCQCSLHSSHLRTVHMVILWGHKLASARRHHGCVPMACMCVCGECVCAG